MKKAIVLASLVLGLIMTQAIAAFAATTTITWKTTTVDAYGKTCIVTATQTTYDNGDYIISRTYTDSKGINHGETEGRLSSVSQSQGKATTTKKVVETRGNAMLK
jgi:hypothetical protein